MEVTVHARVQYYADSAEMEGAGITWQRSRLPPEMF